jgi:hypothetical protein
LSDYEVAVGIAGVAFFFVMGFVMLHGLGAKGSWRRRAALLSAIWVILGLVGAAIAVLLVGGINADSPLIFASLCVLILSAAIMELRNHIRLKTKDYFVFGCLIALMVLFPLLVPMLMQ